jgi:hypothetical protein
MGYVDSKFRPWLIHDFETTAREDIDQFADDMKVDRRLVDPEKIAAAKAKRIEMAAVDIDYARVVCSGIWTSDQDAPYILAGLTAESEREQLTALATAYEDIVLNRGGVIVGFNNRTYDLPLAMRRARLLGVPFPRVPIDKYRSNQIVDLLRVLTFGYEIDRMQWKKLDVYCRLHGIHVADGATGAEVPELIARGDLDAVIAHNLADLQRCHALACVLGEITSPFYAAGQAVA